MAHDVFISYSSKDKPVADAACATLEVTGIRCWIAPRDVLPGMDWSGSIIQAIEQSRAMVLIFSSSANASVQIKREVNRAIEKEVPVIPFRIEDVKPSGSLGYYLDVTHWLDALTPPLEQHLEKLAKDVNLLLKGTGTQHDIPQPRRNAFEPKRERARSRTRLLWIGAVVAALALAVLVGIAVERSWRGREAENMNRAVPVTPSPSETSSPANTQNTEPANQREPSRPTPTPAVVIIICISGYVWREAGPGDHVCVRPEIRDKVASQNALANSRRARGGHGPNTCLTGYVWREAFPGDKVCVTPEEREEAARDNAQAAARVAH